MNTRLVWIRESLHKCVLALAIGAMLLCMVLAGVATPAYASTPDTLGWWGIADGTLHLSKERNTICTSMFDPSWDYAGIYEYQLPWYNQRKSITSVVVDSALAPTYISAWCADCINLTSVDFSALDFSNVESTNALFIGCTSLVTLDLSYFDTSHVIDMCGTFYGCTNLQTIDVSTWDVSKVQQMQNLFYNCRSLESIDLSSWRATRATQLWSMFHNCSNLHEVDVSNLVVCKSPATLANMFDGCGTLSGIDVSGWDTSCITNMSGLFSGCSALATVDLSNFATSNVATMASMFSGCSSLTSLDLTALETENVTNMSHMLDGCSRLESLDVSTWDTSKLSDVAYMFYNCVKLTSLDLSNFATPSLTNARGCFMGCKGLQCLDISKLDMRGVTASGSTTSFFSGTTNLSSVTLGPSFLFGASALCTPPAATTTGKWMISDGSLPSLTNAELRSTYDGSTMAGTWVWEPLSKTHAIIYDLGGGSATGAYPTEFDEQTEFVLPGCEGSAYAAPERYGYDFAGWSPGAYTSRVTSTAGQTTDVKVYAIWTPTNITFTVPATIGYVLKADGTLVGPDNIYLENTTRYPLYVSNLQVQVGPRQLFTTGWSLVSDAESSLNNNAVDLVIGPSGAEVSIADLLSSTGLENGLLWRMDAKENDIPGRLELCSSGHAHDVRCNISNPACFATLRWTIALVPEEEVS